MRIIRVLPWWAYVALSGIFFGVGLWLFAQFDVTADGKYPLPKIVSLESFQVARDIHNGGEVLVRAQISYPDSFRMEVARGGEASEMRQFYALTGPETTKDARTIHAAIMVRPGEVEAFESFVIRHFQANGPLGPVLAINGIAGTPAGLTGDVRNALSGAGAKVAKDFVLVRPFFDGLRDAVSTPPYHVVALPRAMAGLALLMLLLAAARFIAGVMSASRREAVETDVQRLREQHIANDRRMLAEEMGWAAADAADEDDESDYGRAAALLAGDHDEEVAHTATEAEKAPETAPAEAAARPRRPIRLPQFALPKLPARVSPRMLFALPVLLLAILRPWLAMAIMLLPVVFVLGLYLAVGPARANEMAMRRFLAYAKKNPDGAEALLDRLDRLVERYQGIIDRIPFLGRLLARDEAADDDLNGMGEAAFDRVTTS